MTDRMLRTAALRESWIANAEAWTRAVRTEGIASRRLGTDAAVVEAVSARTPRPRRVLDLGCGEGWLARALAARGIAVTGIDSSAPLIEAARQADDRGTFVMLGYEELAADPAKAGTGYDTVVANFSLLGDDMAPVLRAVRRTLLAEGSVAESRGGVLIVQTVHPLNCGAPYRDGWRTEDFHAFGGSGGGETWRPMPWYFRTVGSWVALLRGAGYALEELREPLHPGTGLPLSLLIVAAPALGRAAVRP